MKELSIEYTQYTHMDTAGAMAYSGAEIYRQIKELTFSQGDAWHYGASGERVRLSEWQGGAQSKASRLARKHQGDSNGIWRWGNSVNAGGKPITSGG